MERDVRNTLELYGSNGHRAVSGLMRFGNMSLDDAVDSVRACGGKVEPKYIDALKDSLKKKG